jgi:type IV pilus assembly protein PilW
MSYSPIIAMRSYRRFSILFPRHKQRGLSLIELMVAMVISLVLLGAIGLVYLSSKTGFTYANNTVRMSEDASFALETISRDVRMAGYGGCKGVSFAYTGAKPYTASSVIDSPKGASPTDSTTKSSPKLFRVLNKQSIGDDYNLNLFSNTNGLFSASNVISGVSSGSAGSTERALLPTGSYSIDTNTPILHVMGGSPQALQVAPSSSLVLSPPLIGTTKIAISSDPYNWSNNFGSSTTAHTMLLLISDCNGSELVRATSISAASASAPMQLNLEAGLLNNYNYDALVTPVIASTYFLATRSGSSTPSLYRRYFSGHAYDEAGFIKEELVPNVEAITFQYGINTSNHPSTATAPKVPNDPTYQADIYRSDASAFSDFERSRIVSVRIGLIMVGEDTNQTNTTDTKLEWVGGTYTVPTANAADRRIRRAYSTTVSIRNRTGL